MSNDTRPTPAGPEDLFALLWSFAPHRVLTVAGRTGILKRLAARTGTPDEVAADLGLDPLATGKIVRVLHALGVVEADGDRYAVVPALRAMLVEGDDDVSGFLEHSHRLYERWGATLEGWVRTGTVAERPRTADFLRAFADGMRGGAKYLAPRAAAAIGLDGVRTMIDLGGGTGGYARAFCKAAPALHATVVDLEPVAAMGRDEVAHDEFAGRIDFVGGDYFTADPGDRYDLSLLANVIHIEKAADAARLIAHAASLARPGGRVAVVDFAIDDQRRTLLRGTLFAVNMLSHGDTHTDPDIRAWMAAAGLADVQRTDLDDARWVFTGRKA